MDVVLWQLVSHQSSLVELVGSCFRPANSPLTLACEAVVPVVRLCSEKGFKLVLVVLTWHI